MPEGISNTSPLLYLYRIGGHDWLPKLFSNIWIPQALFDELREGQQKGYDVPNPDDSDWLQIVNPRATPSEWLSLDFGPGELAAMALALENPMRIVLLDDMLARRTAQAAGLTVWGTLKVLLMRFVNVFSLWQTKRRLHKSRGRPTRHAADRAGRRGLYRSRVVIAELSLGQPWSAAGDAHR